MTVSCWLLGWRVARGGGGGGRRAEGEGTVTPFGAAGNCVNFNDDGDDAAATVRERNKQTWERRMKTLQNYCFGPSQCNTECIISHYAEIITDAAMNP